MDIEKIVTLFCRLTTLLESSREQFIDIVNNAYTCVSQRLLKPAAQYTQEEIAKLEYAVGCIAFYDYTVVDLTRERRYLSKTGSFVAESENSPRIKAAALLKKGALDEIKGLVADDGFLFVNV